MASRENFNGATVESFTLVSFEALEIERWLISVQYVLGYFLNEPFTHTQKFKRNNSMFHQSSKTHSENGLDKWIQWFLISNIW